jgi:hypothetical protein
MALVYNRLDFNPGLHALIIGVSRYPHLPDLYTAQNERLFGFRAIQLADAARQSASAAGKRSFDAGAIGTGN